MNRILINTCCVLLFITTAQAQSVGVGTTLPDASAALDIKSSDKGLLIPRVDLAANSITSPATGLMVFNTNNAFNNGTGLYINMGTGAAPNWMQLVPSTAGTFVRNQTTQQANSNFNVSGKGLVGETLDVGGNLNSGQSALTVRSLNAYGTGITIRNSGNNGWSLSVSGTASNRPGTLRLSELTTGYTAWYAMGNKVSVGAGLYPEATLDVHGDIKARGNFLIDMQYNSSEYSIPGNTKNFHTISCPTGYRLVSGGGGHRDWNSAASDIKLNYNGPDPSRPSTTWRVIAQNTSGSSRAMIIYCNCAKIQ